MHAATQTAPLSLAGLWTARAFYTLTVLFLIFDGVTKIIGIVPVVDAFQRLGIPVHLAPGIGIVVLACTAVYAVPRTAVLGAILLTGLYGGAIAIHVRAGSPFFDTYIFPAMMSAFTWVPVFLREPRLRLLLPLRT